MTGENCRQVTEDWPSSRPRWIPNLRTLLRTYTMANDAQHRDEHNNEKRIIC